MPRPKRRGGGRIGHVWIHPSMRTDPTLQSLPAEEWCRKLFAACDGTEINEFSPFIRHGGPEPLPCEPPGIPGNN